MDWDKRWDEGDSDIGFKPDGGWEGEIEPERVDALPLRRGDDSSRGDGPGEDDEDDANAEGGM